MPAAIREPRHTLPRYTRSGIRDFAMRRRIYIVLIAAAVLVAVIFITAVVTFQSDWFKNKIRERIITQVEQTTGGHVDIGRFNYNWSNFTADVSPFILHGTEPPTAPPLFRADKIHVGLKIISVMERTADISSLIVDKPKLHVTVSADGTTNLPTPLAIKRGEVVADILNLKVHHLALTNGFAEYNSQEIPLDLRADDVAADFDYFSSPARYSGRISAHQLHMSSTTIHDAAFDLAAKLTLEKTRIQIQSASLKRDHSSLEVAGVLTELSYPRADLDIKSHFDVRDLAKFMSIPVEGRGEIAFGGKATIRFMPFEYTIDGRLNAHDLAYQSKALQLRKFSVASNVSATPAGIKLPDIDLAGLNGHFRGSATIEEMKSFRVTGVIEGFSVQQIAELQGRPTSELNGTVSGPVQVEGLIANNRLEDVKARTTLQIGAGKTGVPVSGSIEASYEQRHGVVELGNSNLVLGSTVLTSTGNLGQNLTVHLTSSNLHDLVLALPLLGETVPENFPVTLVHGGTARFDGTIIGSLANPFISGRLQLANFETEQHNFTRLDATFKATKSNINVSTLTADGDLGHIAGSGQLGLVNWRLTSASPVQAVAQLLGPVPAEFPITATANVKATISGTYGSPQVKGYVELDNANAYGESFNRIIADATYNNDNIEVLNGSAQSGKAQATFKGNYSFSPADWTTGRTSFNISGRGLSLAQIKAVADNRKGLDGQIDFQATGAAHFVKGDFRLDTLDSNVGIRHIMVDSKPFGDLQATAQTNEQVLDVGVDADLRGVDVQGKGEWSLNGDYPGQGEITIPRITFATLKDIIPADSGRELPFGGFLSATIDISGPLKKPDALKANVTIPELQVNASANMQPRAGAQARDLILRNAGPLRFVVTSKDVDILSARFAGTDTTLQASGRVAFNNDKEPWTLRLNGSINLAILQLFNYDLLATGVATVNATARGSWSQPDINGRLELKNASLFLADLPNGVEKANGVIVFDRNRASVEKLSGESGGGAVDFEPGSFIGFSSGALIYRVQATADHVRYRDPEGLSVTADGSLSLAGTSERSTLSGTVTVIRAAFLPHTDVGSLLASTAKPISVPTSPGQYVRGMQFDIRIDSAQNLEIVTTLTRDIQAEANLRFRGNVDRPILLGEITVTQGQIDFFGNKYTINRGDVTFNNPAKIEPIVDMDLETRVRGITVDVRFNGPLEKLNFSYRSDPPLESSQIIALLAVGREPVGLGALASSQATTNSSYLGTGGNALLAQAISAPVSGRLQRFFGVSHIKIDPQLTDITSVPQARVQFEQQISKDITLTYITNLSRTSEQVVRVEWNVSRRWSVVAVRDENGLFGVDFQYRKTFR